MSTLCNYPRSQPRSPPLNATKSKTGAVLHKHKDWTEARTETHHKTAKWSEVGVRHFRMSKMFKTKPNDLVTDDWFQHNTLSCDLDIKIYLTCQAHVNVNSSEAARYSSKMYAVY